MDAGERLCCSTVHPRESQTWEVADHIEDQPVSVGELASSCEVNADALDRVLRLLTAHGVFDREDGRYGHTPASRLLRSDQPMTMRPFARMMGLPFGWGSLTELAHSIRAYLPSRSLNPRDFGLTSRIILTRPRFSAGP